MDKNDMSFRQQFYVAGKLAEERLPKINAAEATVKPPKTFYARYGKRVLDIALASVACLLTLPINAILAVGTAIDVGRPIVFKQARVGKDGRTFELKKFRNMTNETDENGELLPASQRVTRFGRFVRRTSLDELLNFWFILKGDMSFIGPRPLVPEYSNLYSDRHKCRLLVRPGLECPPRDFHGETRTWQGRFDNDVWYVENLSFKTDCRLVVSLFRLALNSSDSASRAEGSAVGAFLGYDASGIAMTWEDVSQNEVDRFLNERGEPCA